MSAPVRKTKKITCPETAHLEEIDFEVDPVDGRILRVLRCTRFDPPDRVTCECTCAERLNRALGDGTV